MATTAYQAGPDSNDLELSYAPETTWGDEADRRLSSVPGEFRGLFRVQDPQPTR